MKTIDTTIDIAAAPDRVWSVLSDVARWCDWNPFVRRFDGELRPGARVTLEIGPPGKKPMSLRPRVLATESARTIRWLGHLGIPGLFDAEHHLTLEPLADGTTRVHHGEIFRGILVPFLGGVLRDTEAGFVAMNRALKVRAESAA